MGRLKRNKIVDSLMILSILLCLGCAIWAKEPLKFTLSAIYMTAIRYWLIKPVSVIGEELNGPF